MADTPRTALYGYQLQVCRKRGLFSPQAGRGDDGARWVKTPPPSRLAHQMRQKKDQVGRPHQPLQISYGIELCEGQARPLLPGVLCLVYADISCHVSLSNKTSRRSLPIQRYEFGDTVNKGATATITKLQARFLVSAVSCYGGLAGETFGSARLL